MFELRGLRSEVEITLKVAAPTAAAFCGDRGCPPMVEHGIPQGVMIRPPNGEMLHRSARGFL